MMAYIIKIQKSKFANLQFSEFDHHFWVSKLNPV